VPHLRAGFVAAALVLAACGGGADPVDQAAPTTTLRAAPDPPSDADVPDPARPTTTTSPPTTTTTTAPTTTTEPSLPPTTPAPPAPSAPPPPVATAAPAQVPSPPTNASGAEARALQLLNGERASAGMAALRLSGGASSVARSWSGAMASGAGLSHNPDLSGALARAGIGAWRRIAENVGQGSSVDQVHGLFMASSGHRANMLGAGYSEVGIGVVDSGGRVWVTLDFVGY
jgi:uncharacterized protein YkwD